MNTTSIAQTQGPKTSFLHRLRTPGLLLVLLLAAHTARAFQTTPPNPAGPVAATPTVPHPAPANAPPAAAPVPVKTDSTTTPPPPTPSPAVVPGSVPFLIFSSSAAYCDPPTGHKNPCRLGDTLFVGFTNLKAWMDDSKNHLSDLTLVLNGRVMKGLVSRGPDTSYSGLQFDLKMLDGTGPDHIDNRDTWNTLITELRSDDTLHVAVASGGNPPFAGTAGVTFSVFPSWTWAVIVFLLAMLIGFVILAKQSDILRDAPEVGGVKQSYSLARCQMAWWFFITAASFCYIWLTLNNHDSLTQGVLILIGISAATGLASTTIDTGKRDQRNTLVNEQTDLNARVAVLPGLIAAAPPTGTAALQTELATKTARLAAIATELAALPSPIGKSEGFLQDILRDETGISFHRFQMAGWTVILGFVFIAAVYSQLTMPNFSATLLGLMGISSGTYIGFKIPDPTK